MIYETLSVSKNYLRLNECRSY